MVKLKIDGRPVEAEAGEFILQVAQREGIEIPHLCYHEAVKPYGVCRICSVEVIRGRRRRIVTACNYPASEGIEVLTRSDRVLATRKMLSELLLARCPEVPIIQALAKEYGVTETRFPKENRQCIMCGLCVRVCDEVVGAHALGFEARGPDREVVTPYGEESTACIGCGACAYVCPTGCITVVEADGRELVHADLQLGPVTPIRVPTLQSVPNVPFIEKDSCIHFQTGGCKICETVCPSEAINHKMEPEIEEVPVGAIIVATGFRPFDPTVMRRYGYGRLPNVVTSMELEKLNVAAGPTGGRVLMENGQVPRSVGIIHCIGSRDEDYHSYCSRVCCMYSLKLAHLVHEKTHGEVYSFYIDMRAFGKGYEEFYKKILDEGIHLIRGKVAEVIDVPLSPDEVGKLVVRVEDTNIGAVRRIPLDMVVLSVALEPADGATELNRVLNLSCSADGFFLERHPKLAPVHSFTDGIFLAGTCQGPKDIPDTVAQAGAASGEVLSLFDKGVVELEPVTACISDSCCGCQICVALCPYTAITYNSETRKSEVNEALCKGCGTCAAACPSGSAQQKHFRDEQILAEIEGIMQR